MLFSKNNWETNPGNLYLCFNLSNLKHKTAILPFLIATLMLLLISVLPHHHHGQVTCLVTEQCELSAGAETPSNEANCTLSAKNYLVLKSTDLKGGSDQIASDITLFLPVLFLITQQLLCQDETNGLTHPYSPYSDLYRSVLLNRSNSLRAPPVA